MVKRIAAAHAGTSLVLGLVLGLAADSCAAIADLPDWQLAAADASADAPVTTDAPTDTSVAPTDASLDVADANDAGCPFGCPRVAFDFDEGAGTTVHDRSRHGNDGTLQNGPVWSAGVAGGALTFDGVDDVIDIPASPSLDITGTGLSILFWANIDDSKGAGGDDVLVNKAWTMNQMVPPYYQYGVEFSAGSA
jgi:hypothetical protein